MGGVSEPYGKCGNGGEVTWKWEAGGWLLNSSFPPPTRNPPCCLCPFPPLPNEARALKYEKRKNLFGAGISKSPFAR